MKYVYSLLFVLLLATTGDKAIAQSDSVDQLVTLMEEHKGSVIYLDFWASWCIPCKASFPWMNAMQDKYADQGFKVITVNLDAEKPFADQFLKDHPANFTVIYDPTSAIARKFDLKGMPSSYVYNRAGKMVKAHVGFVVAKQSEYEAEIVTLLNQ